MFPHERSLVKKLEGKPFVLLGVNGDDDLKAEDLKKKNEEAQITWRSFKNRRGGDQPDIATEWNLAGWPTLYLIDHQGVIRKKWIGPPTNEVLDKAIDDLVKTAEAGSSTK
jgi:hypothetical protein